MDKFIKQFQPKPYQLRHPEKPMTKKSYAPKSEDETEDSTDSTESDCTTAPDIDWTIPHFPSLDNDFFRISFWFVCRSTSQQ